MQVATEYLSFVFLRVQASNFVLLVPPVSFELYKSLLFNDKTRNCSVSKAIQDRLSSVEVKQVVA